MRSTLAIVTLTSLFTIILVFVNKKVTVKEVTVTVVDTVVTTVYTAPEIYELKGSHYNTDTAQCDSDPFNTADMSRIDPVELNNGNIRWVALSRDMLSRWGGPFNYGDTIYVHHNKPELRGVWYVHDCMNARYTKRIDFLLPFSQGISGKSRCMLICKQPFIIERDE